MLNMGLMKKLKDEFAYIRTLRRVMAGLKDIKPESKNLICDDIERAVDTYPDNLAFIDDERSWTYQQFDEYANRVAHWALSKGLKRGDTVAVFVPNRIEYVALWYGLTKVGIVPALLNYQLRAKALAHCVSISKTKLAIIDHTLAGAWKTAVRHMSQDIPAHMAFGKTEPTEFDAELLEFQSHRPHQDIRKGIIASDVFMKMFTSGTTGLPKAARVSHTRAQFYMRAFLVPAGAGPDDRMMMVLPLYHATGGLCGVGLALMRGGSVIVRESFSASRFWAEAVKFKATLFMYVGELCRFLVNSPEVPQEKQHKIRCIIGNGLRPEVWEKFVRRFHIQCVVEFYGSTEGNISMMNFSGKVGAIGRLPDYLKRYTNGELVRFDVENNSHIRGDDGFYIRSKPGEVGELIGEIRNDEARFRYEGYEDKKATKKKILRDVFKKGDMWFRTGDLMSRDKDGFYFFVDRIGDTFRWKAENVSTNEVADALSRFDGIEQANVYGVPISGYDGKAGMAALVVNGEIDLAELDKFIQKRLPSYARPVFLRISQDTDTTGTFKYKKTDLVKQGFNPAKIKDPLFIDLPGKTGYLPLTPQIYQQILNKKIRL